MIQQGGIFGESQGRKVVLLLHWVNNKIGECGRGGGFVSSANGAPPGSCVAAGKATKIKRYIWPSCAVFWRPPWNDRNLSLTFLDFKEKTRAFPATTETAPGPWPETLDMTQKHVQRREEARDMLAADRMPFTGHFRSETRCHSQPSRVCWSSTRGLGKKSPVRGMSDRPHVPLQRGHFHPMHRHATAACDIHTIQVCKQWESANETRPLRTTASRLRNALLSLPDPPPPQKKRFKFKARKHFCQLSSARNKRNWRPRYKRPSIAPDA